MWLAQLARVRLEGYDGTRRAIEGRDRRRRFVKATDGIGKSDVGRGVRTVEGEARAADRGSRAVNRRDREIDESQRVSKAKATVRAARRRRRSGQGRQKMITKSVGVVNMVVGHCCTSMNARVLVATRSWSLRGSRGLDDVLRYAAMRALVRELRRSVKRERSVIIMSESLRIRAHVVFKRESERKLRSENG